MILVSSAADLMKFLSILTVLHCDLHGLHGPHDERAWWKENFPFGIDGGSQKDVKNEGMVEVGECGLAQKKRKKNKKRKEKKEKKGEQLEEDRDFFNPNQFNENERK